MRTRCAWVVVFVVGLIMIPLCLSGVYADDDDNSERGHHGRESHERRRHRERDFGVVDNPTYVETCGACHVAYPPGLLPSNSWRKILAALPDHNGEEVVVEADALETLGQYLDANAADKSTSRRAARIMSSLNGQSPMRITDVPYITRRHHDISADVFKRESIGSASNCVACHTTAAQGIFDDDRVTIPD